MVAERCVVCQSKIKNTEKEEAATEILKRDGQESSEG